MHSNSEIQLIVRIYTTCLLHSSIPLVIASMQIRFTSPRPFSPFNCSNQAIFIRAANIIWRHYEGRNWAVKPYFANLSRVLLVLIPRDCYTRHTMPVVSSANSAPASASAPDWREIQQSAAAFARPFGKTKYPYTYVIPYWSPRSNGLSRWINRSFSSP